MSINTCSTITTTETNQNKAHINCFVGNDNGDTSHKPAIFKAEILESPKDINQISGKEGELILTSINSDNYGILNSNGDLIITTKDDDVNKYKIEDVNLIYND